jgi:membrane-associated protease RseP (regulator of RpoE activity)
LLGSKLITVFFGTIQAVAMPDQPSPEVLVPSEIYSPGSEHVVYHTRPPLRYWLNVALLLLTFFTTLVVGARLQWNFEHGLPPFPLDESIFPFIWALQGRHLLMGIPFSLTLMTILLAHELGHYLYCLRYRIDATLPFFIPFPTLIGTLGAFIRIRSSLRSRKILFDIGIAGPIAGFAVALPALIFSLGKSHVAPVGQAIPRIDVGLPLIFALVRKLLVLVGHAGSIANVPLNRIYLHPVALAAWVGMFATALNLLPGGQLDGGHIVFAVSPRTHRRVSQLTILALIPLALFCWTGWIIWAVMLRVTGMRHPAVAEWPDISRGRRWLALVALAMLVLTFHYVPISASDGGQTLIDAFKAIADVIRSILGTVHP